MKSYIAIQLKEGRTGYIFRSRLYPCTIAYTREAATAFVGPETARAILEEIRRDPGRRHGSWLVEALKTAEIVTEDPPLAVQGSLLPETADPWGPYRRVPR